MQRGDRCSSPPWIALDEVGLSRFMLAVLWMGLFNLYFLSGVFADL